MSEINEQNFEIFPWNDNFLVGIDIIDEQHKRLVEIVNLLAISITNQEDNTTLVFEKLSEYTLYHFETEEGIWAKYFKDDLWLAGHEENHQCFIEQLNILQQNKEKKPVNTIMLEIISFLANWLTQHIIDSDKRMAIAALAIDSGMSTEEAKHHADNEMSGASALLINTILSMYSNLSKVSMELMREKAMRINAEQALTLSEDRCKFILEGSEDKVWDWDIENDRVDESAQKIGTNEFINSGIKKVKDGASMHPADIDKVKSDFRDHIEGKTEFYVNKHRVIRKNGSWAWTLSRGKIIKRNDDGTPTRMIGTHSDITELELASIIYQESNQAMLICDVNKNIIGINPAFIKMTGYTEDDVIGKNPRVLASGMHDKAFYHNMWVQIYEKGSYSGQIYNKRKNGDIFLEAIDIRAVRDDKGAIDHYFAFVNDITELDKKTREVERQKIQVLQQTRMAQMGEMISMIAHQWRQPLAAISSSTIDLKTKIEFELFDLDTKEGIDNFNAYIDESLTNIEGFVQNLTSTIDDFRNFYRTDKEEDLLAIKEPILRSLNIIRSSLLNDNIELVEHYNCGDSIIMYKNELMQVFLNILKNAQDNFRERNIENKKIVIETASNEENVIITICDNGGGIKEEILQQIFDLYFSTKDQSQGTGLGLYMSKIIIEEHHKGKLFVENRDGGVCFKIILNRQKGVQS